MVGPGYGRVGNLTGFTDLNDLGRDAERHERKGACNQTRGLCDW